MKDWNNIAEKDSDYWKECNQCVASFISPGSSVIDLGCGAQSLKKYLRDCEYIPCDIIKRTEDTLYCDFNADIYPEFNKLYDFLVCSEVLEYVLDMNIFLDYISKMAKNLILTYDAVKKRGSYKGRRKRGWVNDYTEYELEEMFYYKGLRMLDCTVWKNQVIYMLKKI